MVECRRTNHWNWKVGLLSTIVTPGVRRHPWVSNWLGAVGVYVESFSFSHEIGTAPGS